MSICIERAIFQSMNLILRQHQPALENEEGPHSMSEALPDVKFSLQNLDPTHP